MSNEIENGQNPLTDETRQTLKNLSKSFLGFHKILLDASKDDYEAQHGKIPNANVYLQLVIDDPHFAWLRKISSMMALLDEATSLRNPSTEPDAQALINEAKLLVNFEDADENFNTKLQSALQNNANAVIGLNDVKKYL